MWNASRLFLTHLYILQFYTTNSRSFPIFFCHLLFLSYIFCFNFWIFWHFFIAFYISPLLHLWENFERVLQEHWVNFERTLKELRELWKNSERSLKEFWEYLERTLHIERTMKELWKKIEKTLKEHWKNFERTLEKLWKNLERTLKELRELRKNSERS